MSLLFIIKNIRINLFFLVLYKKHKNQPPLSQYGFDVTKIKTKEDITLMICQMIIRDLQPISIVQSWVIALISCSSTSTSTFFYFFFPTSASSSTVN
jgi:hypothetical protein